MRHYVSTGYTPEYAAHLVGLNRWAPFSGIMAETGYKECPGKDTFSQCCGSGFSSVAGFPEAIAGIVVCFSDKKIVLPADTATYTHHQVQVGNKWINFKLRHSEEDCGRSGCSNSLDSSAGFNSLYIPHLEYFDGKTLGQYRYLPFPNGIYLSVVTREQPETIVQIKDKFEVVHESDWFANHNYGNDPNRLKFFILKLER